MDTPSMRYTWMTPSSLVLAVDQRAGLLRRISEVAHVSSPAEQDDLYSGPILRMAGYFGECPVAPDRFADAGGAIRFGLHAGFVALRLSLDAMFAPNLPVETRRTREPIYKYLAFLASMVSASWTARQSIHVTSTDGEDWDVYSAPSSLENWLADGRGKEYEVNWRQTPIHPPRLSAGIYLRHVIDSRFLAQLPREMVDEFMESIAPPEYASGPEGQLQKIVRQAIERTVEFEKNAAARVYTPTSTPEAPDGAIDAHADALAARASEANRALAEANAATAAPADAAPTEKAAPQFPEVVESWVTVAANKIAGVTDPSKISGFMQWKQDGLHTRSDFFGKFGMPGPDLIKILEDAGLVAGRAEKNIILKQALGDRLLPRKKGAAT